ncbi:hypothetical protein Mgra_00008229 [Meloidogyne graminicola]|uniref:Uncharacterized protein n=1 Tax=Meloidogyne graminicola TaxID=189291 RepID=A0A8S9ZGD2_9BILA|nr:hypothetical protein Mgra_00008229 [Meloidogyne graminicola]
MSRVRNEYSSRETGSSPSAFQMEKREQSNNWFKWFAIIISILCVIFMIATIALKINQKPKIRIQLSLLLIRMEIMKNQQISIENLNDTLPSVFEAENAITNGDAGPLSVDGTEILKQRKNRRNSTNSGPQPLNWPPPSGSLHAQYRRVAVATDHGLCSEIGRDIMMEGGNSVDAMIGNQAFSVSESLTHNHQDLVADFL